MERTKFTRDIDLSLVIDINKIEDIIDLILLEFKPRITDAKQFAIDNKDKLEIYYINKWLDTFSKLLEDNYIQNFFNQLIKT